MSIDSVAALGLAGIQRGMQGARSSAAEIASAGQSASTDAADLTAALVSLKQQEQQVAAASKVVKSADDMIGTLIDDLA